MKHLKPSEILFGLSEAATLIITNIPNIWSSPWTYWMNNIGELLFVFIVIVALIIGLPGGIIFVIASWQKASKRFLFVGNLLLTYYFLMSYVVLFISTGE